MKSKPSYLRSFFLKCLLVLPAIAWAQDGATDQPIVYPHRTLSTVIIDDERFTDRYYGDEHTGIPSVLEVPLYVLSAEGVIEVPVPFSTLSGFYRYRGPSTVKFYHSPPEVDPAEPFVPLPPRPSVAASVRLPEGPGDVVLLFFTEDFDRRLYRILAVGGETADFPENSIRFLNFSQGPIIYDLNEQRGRIRRNTPTVVTVDTAERYQRLRLARYDSEGERWRPFMDRYLQIIDGYRSTFLILPRPGSEGASLMVKSIQDNLRLRQSNLAHRDPLEEEEE